MRKASQTLFASCVVAGLILQDGCSDVEVPTRPIDAGANETPRDAAIDRPDTASDASPIPHNACMGVTCSDQGTCAILGGAAICVCAPGYLAEGSTCSKANASGTVAVSFGTSTPTKVRDVGVNIEMGLTSNSMWAANGRWMQEAFIGAGIRFMRWGYNSWAWDWETDHPLDPPGAWSACNAMDESGSLGLKEFIAFCKEVSVLPMMVIPVAVPAAPTTSYSVSWATVLGKAKRMAEYVKAHGVKDAYFELGNEPGLQTPGTGEGTSIADYVARAKDLYPVIKGVSSSFKVVLSSVQYNISTLKTAAAGAFDGLDYHSYDGFADFDGVYATKSDDDFFPTDGTSISGERILGECNVLWPDWFKGPMAHDFQTSVILVNGLLGAASSDRFTRIATWPSHWSLTTERDYGLFQYTAWDETHTTKLLAGPVLAHRIVNEALLENRLATTVSDPIMRVFAYTDGERLHVVLINKGPATKSVELALPGTYHSLAGFLYAGTSLGDENPSIVPYRAPLTKTSGAKLIDIVPARSIVVFELTKTALSAPPGVFDLASPAAGETDASTFKTFRWAVAPGARSYRLIVATDPGLASPVIDVRVGDRTRYQPAWAPLAFATKHYWTVIAENGAGTSQPSSGVTSFTTATDPTIPDDTGLIENGGFENEMSRWWSLGGATMLDATHVHGGTRALRVEAPAGGVSQLLKRMVGGKKYELVFWSMVEPAGDPCWVGVEFKDSTGTALVSQSVQPTWATWTQSKIEVTAPASFATAAVTIWKAGGGSTAYFDDFSIREVP